jgi:TRAP-type uncharacterized transport system substrate-binding protein
MPPRMPHRPPLAEKLWLSQHMGNGAPGEGPAAARAMRLGSIEHLVRSRVRMFLRNTWLVTIVGTLILGAVIWEAIYISTAPTEMRIAAGPVGGTNVQLVELLARKFVSEHDKVRLHLVTTAGPKESAEAITNGTADLAILPSTVGNSLDWPVIASLRQNVIALIVPPPPPPPPPPPETAKKEATSPAPEKSEKTAKGVKAAKVEPKAETKTEAKPETKGETKPETKPETKTETKAATKTAKNEKADKNEKGDKNGKAAKGAKVAKGSDKNAKGADKGDDAEAGDDSGGDTAAAADPNKIDKVTKLAGHRVGIVTGGAATRELLNAVLDHYGVPSSQVQVSLIDPANLADAVKAQQVDVLFAAGPATGKAINEAVAAATRNGQAPTFVPIDQAEGIAKRSPAFESADIDAGTFGGNPPTPDDSLTSLSFAEYLVARKSFSHDGIATLAKLIYTSRLALAAAMPGEIKIAAPSTDKDASVLVHPGALAYLTDDQKTFFDKYGDDIFYGLLIFPIFGSAIAGVASYFRSSGRTKRLRLLQRVLDLVRKAPSAPTLEALDQMQTDVDHLVVAIIHQSEHEEYDQATQNSFTLALDQVRFAIAHRRAVLLGHGDTAEAKTGAHSKAAASQADGTAGEAAAEPDGTTDDAGAASTETEPAADAVAIDAGAGAAEALADQQATAVETAANADAKVEPTSGADIADVVASDQQASAGEAAASTDARIEPTPGAKAEAA